MSVQPILAIVGRPSVGKSTLFNRLTRSRRALVHDLPWVTRDRLHRRSREAGRRSGDRGRHRRAPPRGRRPLRALDQKQAEVAITGGDVVLLLLDGEAGPIPENREISEYLRALGVPVVHVVNKADRKGVDLQSHEFYRLGLGEPVLVSAEHGTGLVELIYQPKGGHDGRARQPGDVAETFDPAELLARVIMHVPEPRRHLVRYYGAFSNVSRGKRRRQAEADDVVDAILRHLAKAGAKSPRGPPGARPLSAAS